MRLKSTGFAQEKLVLGLVIEEPTCICIKVYK